MSETKEDKSEKLLCKVTTLIRSQIDVIELEGGESAIRMNRASEDAVTYVLRLDVFYKLAINGYVTLHRPDGMIEVLVCTKGNFFTLGCIWRAISETFNITVENGEEKISEEGVISDEGEKKAPRTDSGGAS